MKVKGIFEIIFLLTVYTVNSENIYEINEAVNKEITIQPSEIDFKFKTLQLDKIDSIDNLENKIILRRKFGTDSYVFYEAKAQSEYFSDLERFIPKEDIKKLLDKKFFKRTNDNPNNDILNVYFYRNSVFIENVAKIYYYKNGWQRLQLYQEDSAPITFLSYPDSVDVLINGINYGKTPLILNEITPGINIIEYKKNDYYCYEFLINKNIDIPILKRVIMQRMPVAPEGTYIDPQSYSHGSSESIRLLISTLNRYNKEYNHISQAINNAKSDYIKKYPPLQPIKEFENINTFNRRKNIYIQNREAGLLNVNNSLVSELYDVEQKLLYLTNYLEIVKRRQFNRFYNSEKFNLGSYDVYKEEFPITIRVNEDSHNFNLTGTLSIPFSKAEQFKNDVKNSLVKINYKCRILTDGLESDNFLVYEYTGLSVLYKGSEYRVDGEFELFNDKEISNTVMKNLGTE